MAYLDTRQRPSAGSMAAVVAIHAGVGAALIFGLTVTGIIPEDAPPIPTWDLPKPPPPPDQPKPEQKQTETPDRKVTVPMPKLPVATATPDIATTFDDYPPLPPLPPRTGDELKPVIPTATPSFAPVAAKPRNDPARWVSTDDYRSSWINQNMTGRARFRLEIAADGRVTNCTITGSSGHQALDTATCALVSKRARFQPARGSEGEPVAGSYSNAIDWQLPD